MLLNVANILEFADTVKMEDVEELIGRQIDYNTAISDEGLKGNYGVETGRILMENAGNASGLNRVRLQARAAAAAGSDARMSGCSLPVVINSGSGNQGISTTLPMAVFADRMNIPEEKLLRAEFMGMLMIMYMKKYVGRLSPVCGAMLAGTGSAAGMAYMLGGTAAQVSGAVQNMMGSVAGIFCDGAKGGCAVKVAACASEAVYAAMYAMDGSVIGVSDGINSTKAEDTAKNLAKLSHEALDTLDMKVIEIMQTKK